MKAIILAAGYATRMFPLTENTPKALLPFGGRCVIDYIIDQLINLPAVNEIIVVTNDKYYGAFLKWAEAANSSIPIKLLNDGSTSNSDRLGAIGDIQFAVDKIKIDSDVLIIAADNYFTFNLKDMYDAFIKTNCDLLCAKHIEDKELLKGFAVAETDENNKILTLVEKPQDPQSNTALFAVYFYKKETVPMFKKYLDDGNPFDAPGYFPQWLHKIKNIYAWFTDGECYDIGTIAAYNELNKKMENNTTEKRT
ncbi:MAG: nucleotidyltransferase family protein [Defluviitaleaceae bacterium]|nr:nucleotidyltransferase family protein [Defluviitaleaceae bacterium]